MSLANQSLRLNHIEILRGLSITLVLLYHLRMPGFSFAYLGVDVFFVISGFLIANIYVHISTWDEISAFYSKRLSRILPAYFFVLLACIIASAVLTLPHEFLDVIRSTGWAAVLAPNIGFWIEADYFDPTFLRPLLNLWSLGVEIQFYFIFPIIAIIGRRSSAFVWLLMIVSLALYMLIYYVSQKTAFFLTPLRLWEFLAGYQVAKIKLRLPGGSGTVGLLSLLALVLVSPALPVPATVLSVLTAILSALVILSGLSARIESSALGRCFIVLGKYSYSIYLVHFPTIVFLAYEPFEGTSLNLTAMEIVLALVCTAFFSVMVYRFVEFPLRGRWPGRTTGIAAFCSCLLVAAVGLIFDPREPRDVAATPVARDVCLV